MELKQLQELLLSALRRRSKENGTATATVEYALLKIGEEYGELAQAYLIHKKQCKKSKLLPEEESKRLVAYELADVVGAALVVADMLDIDVEDVLLKKWMPSVTHSE